MNYNYLKRTVFDTVEISFGGDIEFKMSDGVYASYNGKKAVVGGCDESAVCRALCEFAYHIAGGETDFEITGKRSFEKCGVMLDVSRGGVLKVETVKEYICNMAALGLNLLMLYTEDVYEMKKYPYFGYQRGRYTVKELREIDDYAFSLGIEVVPCIQTLGHMEKYLTWHEADSVRDTENTLMPDDEKTYAFLRDCVRTMKAAFRSDVIHIGMDEAVKMGTGNYFKKHSSEGINQNELFLRHLQGVYGLCREEGYDEVMMWSDMIFSMENANQKGNYDEKTVITKATAEKIPPVIPVYWYYSSMNQKKYSALIKKHREFAEKVAFAGSGWSFETFVPNTSFAWKCNVPALNACADERVEYVINTLWGDSGSECSYFLCMPINALYAEYFYSGDGIPSEEKAWKMSEFVTKYGKKEIMLADELGLGQYGEVKAARKFLRRDIFNVPIPEIEGEPDNIVLPSVSADDIPKRYVAAADALKIAAEGNARWKDYFLLTEAVLRVAADKCSAWTELQSAYHENDTESLTTFCNIVLPRLKKGFELMYKRHEKVWFKENKAFGWNYHCMVYGYQILRLQYAAEMLEKYISGKINEIPELEQAVLNQAIPNYDIELR